MIVQPNTLVHWLQEKDVILLDVRSNLQEPDKGELAYKTDHLPGAFYLHLTKDLSGEVGQHGGNHPLPNLDTFAEKLGSIGITQDKTVVIYDTNNDMFAARAWWLLQYIGHENTYILDGGYNGWKKAGYEVSSLLPNAEPAKCNVRTPANMIVSMEEVKNREDHVTVIDSRSKERYLGDVEPLYKKAGHIPGAVHSFWKDVLDEQGGWKSQEQLELLFQDLNKSGEIIVSCGSGISACPNIAALKQAGFHNVKLYPGSFSDWISYDDNIVEKGEA